MKSRPCDTQRCVNVCGEGNCGFFNYVNNDGCAFKPVHESFSGKEFEDFLSEAIRSKIAEAVREKDKEIAEESAFKASK